MALPECSDRGRPYHADSIRADYLVPTGLQLGLGRIGFHTFRHTYRARLDETGAPVGVQQKLMRHAHISTTMDIMAIRVGGPLGTPHHQDGCVKHSENGIFPRWRP